MNERLRIELKETYLSDWELDVMICSMQIGETNVNNLDIVCLCELNCFLDILWSRRSCCKRTSAIFENIKVDVNFGLLKRLLSKKKKKPSQRKKSCYNQKILQKKTLLKRKIDAIWVSNVYHSFTSNFRVIRCFFFFFQHED